MRRRRFLALAAGAAAAAPARAQLPPPPLGRIAFGSCAHQDYPQPIWGAVLAYRPDLFIFAGDNVYGDFLLGDAGPLRAAYAKARQIDGYMRVRREARTLATWDDHDYGLNDGGAEWPHKNAAKREFLSFWEIADDDPRRSRPGLYHAERFGADEKRVQVILLDTRSFRSSLKPTDRRGAPGKERYVPDPDPSKTMLGDAQWQWLRETLAEPAELRLVVSSVQLLAEGHGWERWGNLPRERQRFFDIVAETRAAGVVILSGDRHIGALYREARGVPYPLVEVTSSGLNMTFPNAREESPNRLGALYGFANFGTIDIDWWERSVTLALRDEAGQVRRRLAVDLDALKP
jgi:alkaline phosphatase D